MMFKYGDQINEKKIRSIKELSPLDKTHEERRNRGTKSIVEIQMTKKECFSSHKKEIAKVS